MAFEPVIHQLNTVLLEGSYPDFSGLWLDPEVPGLVHLAWASAPRTHTEELFIDERTAELMRSVPRELLVSHARDTTAEELQDLRGRIAEDFHALHRDLGLVGFAIRYSEGVVKLEAEEQHHVQALSENFANEPVNVRVVGRAQDSHYPTAALACFDGDEGCNPLRGGIKLTSCTAGFSAYGGSYQYLLTAGHCNNTQSHEGHSIGTVYAGYQQVGGTTDAQAHRIPSGTFANNRYVYHRNDAQAYQIQSVNTLVVSENGTLCVSPASAYDSRECAGVQSDSWSGDWFGTDFNDMLQLDSCRQDGSSGAPVYASFKAYGIYKGFRTFLGACSYGLASHTDNVVAALSITGIRTS